MEAIEQILDEASLVVPRIVTELWESKLSLYRRLQPVVIDKADHRRNLTTPDDEFAEDFLKESLIKIFPSVGFVGEENNRHIAEIIGPHWVVDSIDGTLNYTEDVRSFATSIALVSQREVIYGCIYDPTRKELFTSRRGRGVYLGKEKLGNLSDTSPDRAILSFGLGYEDDKAELMWEVLGELRRNLKGVRASGCASMDLAHVAAGRSSCFVHPYLKDWDRFAGELMVQEVGGNIIEIKELRTKSSCGLIYGRPSIVKIVYQAFEKRFLGK